ncbi:MAG: hypothetical protein MJY77_07665 [Bacteroidaceae bacterium]|nr:hypothetical protein [Bacteroidaceae bacterium]
MKRILCLMCIVLASFPNVSAQNEDITNETVIELLNDGFSSSDIIGLLETSSNRNVTFSVAYMRELKEAGASSDLIQYLQKISKTDFGMEGVYWYNTEDSKPMKIYRSQFEQEENSFNMGTVAGAALAGAAIAAGISGNLPSPGAGAAIGAGTVLLASTGKDVQKLTIMGTTSKNVVNTTRPVFRFYLPKQSPDQFAKEADNWYYGIMNQIMSPNEFQLVIMKQKKNRRVFPSEASYSVAGFSSSNAKKRVVVDFQIEEVNNNTFDIIFNEDLVPGEYVFFWKNGLSSEIFKQHVFGFDFSIPGAEVEEEVKSKKKNK